MSETPSGLPADCAYEHCNQPTAPGSVLCAEHAAVFASRPSTPPLKTSLKSGPSPAAVRNVWIGAIVIVLAVVLIGVLHKTPSSTHSDAGGPAVPSAAAPNPGADVYAWFTGVKPDLMAIQQDEVHLGHAGQAADIQGVLSACASLKDDVVTFEADPSSPDDEIRQDLAHAMDAYSTAASECLNRDFAQSGHDNDQGTNWIYKVTARIKELQ